MSNNLTAGPVQVYGATVAELNQAFMELQNRLDALKGLRGRAEIFDRVRHDNPTASDDGVALGILQAGTAFASIPLFLAPTAPLLVATPGTTYVELSATLRQQVNFASPQSLEGRVLVEAWGTESGSGKGVAVTTSAGAVIAQVTWTGSTPGLYVGTFGAISQSSDQAVQVRFKGATSTESLILHSIYLDLRYSITVV